MKPASPKKSVTIRDVAREAEVSVASASRALNGLGVVADETKARVLNAARKLRYVPHVGARSLITQRTGMIGVLLPDVYGEFFSEFVRGVDGGARTRGYHLFVSGSHGDADEAAEVIQAMRGRVDGMIVMSPHVDEHFVANHLHGDPPVVLMNVRCGAKHHPTINIDNYRGAKLMVRHLADQGCRQIALIAGPKGNYDAEERLRGYRAAMTALRLDAGPILQGDFSEDSGRAVGGDLARAGALPDAVFALNDMMAIGCLSALAEAGIATPQQIAVAGFDDVPIARFVTPGLTTIRVDIARLGRAAFQKLSCAIERTESEAGVDALSPELVVRGSTTPRAEGGTETRGGLS